jgi:hypothetical protein
LISPASCRPGADQSINMLIFPFHMQSTLFLHLIII